MKSFQPRSFIKVSAGICILAGILVIIGWLTGNENLKAVVAGLAPMKFNTAICFILCGIALFLILNNTKKGFQLQTPFLLVVAALALTTFFEYSLKFNSGLDELFVKDHTPLSGALDFSGRMAAPTAISFVLLSLSLIAITFGRTIIKLIAQYILHFVTVISFIVLMGYLYNIPTFYRLSAFSSMALNTSVLFCLLSISASLVNPSFGIVNLLSGKTTGSIMARRLFPLIAIIILIMGIIRMQIHKLNMVSENLSIAIFVTSTIIVCLFLIALTAIHLDKIDAKRRIAEESLKSLNIHLQDLVEKRTADLQQITERLSLATSGSKIGIWDWDIENNKLTWDDKMYKLYGISADTFAGTYEAWENCLHPDDKDAGKKATRSAIKGEKEYDLDLRVIWPDNSVHYLRIRSLTQRDADGKATRMIGTNWDITERILLQKELEDQKEESQKIVLKTAIESQENERKQIGFELNENVNQILTAVNMHLGLIKGKTDAETAEFLNDVSIMIKEAMDGIHKITHNIGNSYIEDIGLKEALADLVYKMNALRIFEVEINLDVEGLIIPAPVELTIYRFIQQQLNNILNFAEASKVVIQLYPEDNNLVLEIADNGKGADPADISKDINLSIMQSRAKAYNGKVDIDTSPGKGFKMTVTLPFKQPSNQVEKMPHGIDQIHA